MYLNKKVIAIILSAGSGSRFQGSIPKQYYKINNKFIAQFCIDTFSELKIIDEFILVHSKKDKFYQNLYFSKPVRFVTGGKERSDSVLEALKIIDSNEIVLIHDSARACVSKNEITNLITSINEDGSILALPSSDTLKEVDNKYISKTLNRDKIYRALTPQCFYSDSIKEAIIYCSKLNITITDDSSAMENYGKKPHIVLGSSLNIKLTYSSDFDILKYILQLRNK
ncbi:MAG: 2-C-methyl-D-erythritol 4-phosphate cytidylyltransferase [Psittacicella sp.]